jgi:hypothetical protein
MLESTYLGLKPYSSFYIQGTVDRGNKLYSISTTKFGGFPRIYVIICIDVKALGSEHSFD